MRSLSVTSLVLALLVAAPPTASAQERLPVAGTSAVGFDVGAMVPRSDELSSSMLVSGLYEYYLTPRVSLRGQVDWSNPHFAAGAVDSLMQTPLLVDASYNWRPRGDWQPFVSGGVGMYVLRFSSDAVPGNGQPLPDNVDSKFGVNAGGGVEYFLSRRVAIKGEGRHHFVDSTRGEEPSATTVAVGLKTYF